MENNIFNRLVYLDHNVLDQMTKGDPKGIRKFIESGKFIVGYSTENLNEIRRSKGYENSFIKVLKDLKARHIIPEHDGNFRYSGTARVIEGDPAELFQSYINNSDVMPEFGYGLSGILKKMYGGLTEHTFSEIFEKGIDELIETIGIPEEKIDELDLEPAQKEELKQYVRMLPETLKNSYSDIGNMLDIDSTQNQVKELEKTTGIGPRVLKNISGPGVLNQVWRHIEQSIPLSELTLEKFFGLEPSEWSNEPGRKLSIYEKVNAIYHQLNYIGYFRDSNMKKERRFTASLSDMTHAGMATFCKLFICRDEDLTMKAAAAYEHLRLHTQIIHIKN